MCSSDLTADLADDAVTEAKVATDAIGLTELKAGTDGELITWDASGDPAAVAVGTATHVLTSNGTGVAPTFQAAAAAVRQVKVFTDFAEITTTSQTFVDATGRSVSFTPTATDSILRISYSDQFGGELSTSSGTVLIGISRGAYASGVLLSQFNATRNTSGNSNLHFRYAGYIEAWDAPATTSATTYNIYWKSGDVSTTGRLAEGAFTRTGTTSANNKGNHITIIEYSPDVATMPTYTD